MRNKLLWMILLMTGLTSYVHSQPASLVLPQNLTAQPGSQIHIPVSVLAFDSVCNISLVFSYDTNVLAYTGFSTQSAYSGGMSTGNKSKDQFRFAWFSAWSYELADMDTLLIVHFNYLGGSTQLIWNLSPDECVVGDCEAGVKPVNLINGTVSPETAVGQISGTLVYDNNIQSPLAGVMITLTDAGNQPIGSTVSDNSGYYSFEVTAPGIYHLEVLPALPWGGVNSTDALRIVQHFAGVSPLDGLALAAADVNANGYVNAGDALAVLKRFAGLTNSFPSGDWVFELPLIQMDNLTSLTVNVKALFNGDVDRSYIP